MRILFVSSEIYPLAKSGGLPDVSAALPMALADLVVDIRLLLPGYPLALEKAANKSVELEIADFMGAGLMRLIAARLPLWLIDCPALFRRSGGLYKDDQGADWADNAKRFAVLSHAAALLARGGRSLPCSGKVSGRWKMGSRAQAAAGVVLPAWMAHAIGARKRIVLARRAPWTSSTKGASVAKRNEPTREWMMADRHAEIEMHAYRLWEQEGRPEGRALDHWLRAESQVEWETHCGAAAPPNPMVAVRRSGKRQARARR